VESYAPKKIFDQWETLFHAMASKQLLQSAK
jgi:hypothetical protein